MLPFNNLQILINWCYTCVAVRLSLVFMLQDHPYVRITNLCFGCLSVFHLAYLGLMFDSSEEAEKVSRVKSWNPIELWCHKHKTHALWWGINSLHISQSLYVLFMGRVHYSFNFEFMYFLESNISTITSSPSTYISPSISMGFLKNTYRNHL